MKESLYGLLGIAQNASLDEIKTAYSNKMSMLEGKYDEASDVERKKNKMGNGGSRESTKEINL